MSMIPTLGPVAHSYYPHWNYLDPQGQELGLKNRIDVVFEPYNSLRTRYLDPLGTVVYDPNHGQLARTPNLESVRHKLHTMHPATREKDQGPISAAHAWDLESD